MHLKNSFVLLLASVSVLCPLSAGQGIFFGDDRNVFIATPPEEICYKHVFPRPITCSISEKLSCRKRCGSVSSRPTKMLEETYCSCDSLCHIYGDCCYDVEFECSAFPHTPVLPSGSCLPKEKLAVKSYVINKCAPDWTGPDLCNIITLEKGEYFPYYFPVYNGTTSLSYVNYLCARCNFITDFIPWNYDYRCLRPTSYQIDALNIYNQNENCVKYFTPPENEVRNCYNINDVSCHENCTKDMSQCELEDSPFIYYYHDTNVNVNNETARFNNLECISCIRRNESWGPPDCGPGPDTDAVKAVKELLSIPDPDTVTELKVKVEFTSFNCIKFSFDPQGKSYAELLDEVSFEDKFICSEILLALNHHNAATTLMIRGDKLLQLVIINMLFKMIS